MARIRGGMNVSEIRLSQTPWQGSLNEHNLVYNILDVCWRLIPLRSSIEQNLLQNHDYFRVLVEFGKLNNRIVKFLRQMDPKLDSQHSVLVQEYRKEMRQRWPTIEANFQSLYGLNVDGDFPEDTKLITKDVNHMPNPQDTTGSNSQTRRSPMLNAPASPRAQMLLASGMDDLLKDARRWAEAVINEQNCNDGLEDVREWAAEVMDNHACAMESFKPSLSDSTLRRQVPRNGEAKRKVIVNTVQVPSTEH